MKAHSLRWFAVLTMGAAAGCTSAAERVPALASIPVAQDEKTAEFTTAGEAFASPGDCVDYLERLIPLFPSSGYEIARGPYPLAEGDMRIHAIAADDGQYRVAEYRCIGTAIEARSWWAGDAQPDVQPFTLDDIRQIRFPEAAGPSSSSE